MYTLHTKKELGTLRIFEDGKSYDNRDEPIFSCLIHYISDKKIYLCKAVGKVDALMYRIVFHQLYLENYEEVEYERHGKLRTVDLSRFK